MTTRFIESDRDRTLIHRFIDTQELPFTVSISKGGKRSVKQNRLQMLWLNEIAGQLEGQSVEEIRAYCKLTIGVPILRNEHEDFREKYDAVVKPLSGYPSFGVGIHQNAPSLKSRSKVDRSTP